jgi:hypothetical protein
MYFDGLGFEEISSLKYYVLWGDVLFGPAVIVVSNTTQHLA